LLFFISGKLPDLYIGNTIKEPLPFGTYRQHRKNDSHFLWPKVFGVTASITGHKYYSGKEHHYCCLVEKEEGTAHIPARIQEGHGDRDASG
jgi:hypothetical protein